MHLVIISKDLYTACLRVLGKKHVRSMHSKLKHIRLIIGVMQLYSSKIGKMRLPLMAPILPIIICMLTAIVLKDVGKSKTLAPTVTLKDMLNNPIYKHVRIRVVNVFVDQIKDIEHRSAHP